MSGVVHFSSKFANFEMKDVKPEVASDFLNALADWTKNKVEKCVVLFDNR